MKSLKILAVCAALLASMPGMAQDTAPRINYQFGGSVLNHDMLWAPDLAELSRTHVFGTARVMGMGGAFVSLGADLSSMSLNPAGLGMYRRSELSLTPLVPMSNGSTKGSPSWVGNNKTSFAFANIGVALNVLERSSGALTSLTIGFGMNRIADFNTRYSYSSESVYDPASGNYMPTIADIFSQQLNTFDVYPNDNNEVPVRDWNPNVWPAILGYDGFMVGFYPDGGNNPWGVERIGGNASVLHSMDVVNNGSVNEFDLSVGGNINNIVYFGATLGIQSIYKRSTITYQEEYGYFNSNGIAQTWNGNTETWSDLPEQLDRMNLYQRMVMDGSGVNFKLGVVVRPTTGLRLGMAFHTPTYYSLDYSYEADLFSDIRDNSDNNVVRRGNNTPRATNEDYNSWDFTSPARLMFGASYTFGNFAIVSVDYERDWYNGIRLKNVPYDNYLSPEDYKQEFKSNFQGTNSFRAGVEIKPLPILSLRFGGGYTDSMLKDRDYYVYNADSSMPVTYKSYYFSAGLGVSLSRSVTLDVAYQNLTDKLTEYQLFFSRDLTTGDLMTWSGTYDTSLTRHYIAMTLGFRF